MKKIAILLWLLPITMQAQQYPVCPLDHHLQEVYENPLNERWLSRYDVKFYHLSLEVSNEHTRIEGYTSILTEATDNIDTLVFQLIDEMTVTGVEVNGSAVPEYSHRDDVLYLPVIAVQGDLITTTIHYLGDANQDRGFFAGMTSSFDNTNQQWVTYTLSEPLNARDWFPVKQVLSDKADSVWVDIICDQNLMAGSNGLLTAVEELPENRHKFRWKSNYPIAYYLISIAVANYRDYSFNAALSENTDSVLVQNFIYDDDKYFLNWKDRIDKTGEMITLFSTLIDDYPFAREKYGHAVAPMGGGMEHQTMTTLSNFNFTLVAHELAHQWFGDNITCGTWQDIWINEGFASYLEYIALENLYNQDAADGWMENAMSAAFGKTGSVYVPQEEAENVFRVFDYGLSYKKGAVLLHMIRYELNDDALFFDVLKSYTELYSDSVATAVDFREVLELKSGMDFTCFFDQWYYGTGYPNFTISAEVNNDTLYIHSLQETSTVNTPLFRMHFDLAVKTSMGEIIYRLFQEQQEHTFTIPVSDIVYDIRFDPLKKLLATSSVSLELPDGKDFVMGPNPFSESIILRFRNSSGTEQLEIFNLNGKQVMETTISSNPFELDMASLRDGPYVLVIQGPYGKYSEKIVKLSREL